MKRIIVLIMICVSCSSLADVPDALAKKEIAFLIDHLAASGCRFNRNGQWYDASRAVTHLNRKYQYLLDREMISNTESFIDRAASESSSTGKPYLVKCADKPEVPSAAWFREALAKLRAESRNAQEHH